MFLRQWFKRLKNRKVIKKFICGITTTSFALPCGMIYAAENQPSVVNMAEKTSMFDKVPADSWIYTSINKLIATGKVPRYKNQIKKEISSLVLNWL